MKISKYHVLWRSNTDKIKSLKLQVFDHHYKNGKIALKIVFPKKYDKDEVFRNCMIYSNVREYAAIPCKLGRDSRTVYFKTRMFDSKLDLERSLALFLGCC